MLNINLRIDSVGYSEKPTKDEAAVINSRLSKIKCKPIKFDDFCFLIGSKGHSFCISDFYGKRKKENFKSQQIFALDFDGGANFQPYMIKTSKRYVYYIILEVLYKLYTKFGIVSSQCLILFTAKSRIRVLRSESIVL